VRAGWWRADFALNRFAPLGAVPGSGHPGKAQQLQQNSPNTGPGRAKVFKAPREAAKAPATAQEGPPKGPRKGRSTFRN